MQTQRSAALVVALVSVVVGRAGAQTDYRNLDDDRPVRMEDAYVTGHYAFEFTAPYRYERGAGSGTHAVIPELTWGVLRDLHVGLKLPFAIRDGTRSSAPGLSGARLFAVRTLWTESGGLPAVAVRADLTLPVGAFAEQFTVATVKGIATRSFGSFRLHANAAVSVGRLGRAAYAEAAERWWVGVAADRTFLRSSVLLVAEAYLARARTDSTFSAGSDDLHVGVGFRWQWTPATVLDAGYSASNAGVPGETRSFTIGLTHSFAIASLMPGGGR